METKRPGATEVMLPAIGLGFWRYRGGPEPLLRGVEVGAFLLDTAEIYGTEELVGAAIHDCRDRVFVATKVAGNHLRFDDVLRAAEGSLKRLATGVIDLYQIHWPNPAVPIGETMRAMETLVDRRLVRYIGVSQFSTAELHAARAAMNHYPIVANQVRYSLNARRIEMGLLDYCEQNQVTIIAYTPLDDGRLASLPAGRNRRMQVLTAIAAQTRKTLGQVALNWCIAHPSVIAIPKSNSVSRTVENCLASGWRLTPSQIKQLDTAFSWRGERIRARLGEFRRRVRSRLS